MVSNYLMADPSFDLLFWNADATRMPAAMHMYYLRNMYQKNLLVQPGGIVIDNADRPQKDLDPDLHQAGKEDHCTGQVGLQGNPALHGPVRFAGGLGHRGRRQPAVGQEIHALAERDVKESADAR